MAVILVLVQVGLLVRDHILVAHATREAARAAAITPSTEAARTAAHKAVGLDLAVQTSGGRVTGQQLQVQVSYKTHATVPLIKHLFPDITITETLTVRVE